MTRLEVKMNRRVSGVLKERHNLGLSIAKWFAASADLGRRGLGALFLVADRPRLGRKKLFFITPHRLPRRKRLRRRYLGIFGVCAVSPGNRRRASARMITKSIRRPEMITARGRGGMIYYQRQLWIGAALGAVAAIVLLDHVMNPASGGVWRSDEGGAWASLILVIRRWIPRARAG